jgi:peptide/nickel transport system substrate-binding protein
MQPQNPVRSRRIGISARSLEHFVSGLSRCSLQQDSSAARQIRFLPVRMAIKPLVIVAVLVVLALSSCGSDGDGKAAVSRNHFAPLNEPPADSQRGGTLSVLAAGDVDSLDSGIAYYQFSYMVMLATQRTLLSWPPDQAEHPQPDLAAEPPEVSDDGRTLTFTIRGDVRFAPPVGRRVRASDFKYAIERSLLPGVPNPYVETYLGDLVGFEAARRAAETRPRVAPEIAGIRVSDPDRLTLTFSEPATPVVLQALSLPLAAPVPPEYARPFDAESPSSYGQHVVGTGPYMVENDSSGQLTGYQPGQRIELVRNPNWDPKTDYRPAYLDSIVVKEGFTDPTSAARKILAGESEVNGDFSPGSTALKDAATKHEAQLSLAPLGLYRYIALNTTIPPLDNVNVRRAIAAALDRKGLRLILGGKLVGPIATHYLPPGIPGFEQAGGYLGPDLDFMADPAGDPKVAAAYLRKAGESGDITDAKPLLMIGDAERPGRGVAEIVLETLRNLGLDVDLRLLSHDTMITRFCNVPKAAVAVCPNGGWVKDFNDPQTLLYGNFSGRVIRPTNNSNWSQFNDPKINQLMEQAKRLTDPEQRAEAWGRIDRKVMAKVPAIPWSWDYSPMIASENVINVINAFTGNTDLSFASLRSGGG